MEGGHRIGEGQLTEAELCGVWVTVSVSDVAGAAHLAAIIAVQVARETLTVLLFRHQS